MPNPSFPCASRRMIEADTLLELRCFRNSIVVSFIINKRPFDSLEEQTVVTSVPVPSPHFSRAIDRSINRSIERPRARVQWINRCVCCFPVSMIVIGVAGVPHRLRLVLLLLFFRTGFTITSSFSPPGMAKSASLLLMIVYWFRFRSAHLVTVPYDSPAGSPGR